jgi:hypothetical protein
MACCPSVREAVKNCATPLPLRGSEARSVAPSVKLIMPVGDVESDSDNVAVKVTTWPTFEAGDEDVRVTDSCCASADERTSPSIGGLMSKAASADRLASSLESPCRFANASAIMKFAKFMGDLPWYVFILGRPSLTGEPSCIEIIEAYA